MGLAPAAKNHLVELEGVYCDCKTGVSGAGKKPNQKFHYPEQYDTSYAYKLSGHQHVMEIERELSAISGKVWNITFTPQVVPMTRGIISTIYGRLEKGMNQDKVEAAYREFYKGSYFVRVLGLKDSTSTGDVRGSNFINIQVACDERTGTFRIISHIDNLMKGQAGSAVQNLNVMFGLEESTGLSFPGAHP
jgi:N-acetyl-gamma-glutamyl-phosphate reductase